MANGKDFDRLKTKERGVLSGNCPQKLTSVISYQQQRRVSGGGEEEKRGMGEAEMN